MYSSFHKHFFIDPEIKKKQEVAAAPVQPKADIAKAGPIYTTKESPMKVSKPPTYTIKSGMLTQNHNQYSIRSLSITIVLT